MFLLLGAVVCFIGNITRDFPFNWIVFASVSYNLRASRSPIVLKIRTRNFSLAATGIITETRAPLHRQGRNSLPCSLSRQYRTLQRTRSNAKRRLATFVSGRLRRLLKIGQPFNNNFV